MRFFHLGWFLASLYWYCFLSTSLILWIVIDYIVHDTSLYKNVRLQQKVKQIASGKFKKPINLYTSSLHVPYMVCRNARVWAITKQLLMNILSSCWYQGVGCAIILRQPVYTAVFINFVVIAMQLLEYLSWTHIYK